MSYTNMCDTNMCATLKLCDIKSVRISWNPTIYMSYDFHVIRYFYSKPTLYIMLHGQSLRTWVSHIKFIRRTSHIENTYLTLSHHILPFFTISYLFSPYSWLYIMYFRAILTLKSLVNKSVMLDISVIWVTRDPIFQGKCNFSCQPQFTSK
jgi:hypothetical protein